VIDGESAIAGCAMFTPKLQKVRDMQLQVLGRGEASAITACLAPQDEPQALDFTLGL